MAHLRCGRAQLLWRDDADGRRRIEVAGALTGESLGALPGRLLEALTPPPQALVLDLDLVAVIDTAGIAFLIELLRMAHQPHVAIESARWGSRVDGFLRVHRFPEMLAAYQQHLSGSPSMPCTGAEEHPQFVFPRSRR